MLNRLFNYLKAKHLPASTSFKNRLYLERDIKSRRIVANFGATFRNSKWSDYSLTNVNLKHKAAFLNFIKILIIFSLTIALVYSYYLYSHTWLVHIAISYFSSIASFFYIWYLYIYLVTPLLFKNVTSALWGNLFKNSFNSENTASKFVSNSEFEEFPNTLTTDVNYSTHNSSNYFFAKPLYTTIQHLNLISTATPHLSVNSSYDYVIKYPLQLQSSELNVDKTSSNQFTLSNPLTRSKFGSFYLNKTDWHLLSSTFINVLNRSDLAASSIGNHSANVKTLRWTYRYNMLHRHVLNGATQLTSTKKLLSTGFLDSTSTTKNIWFSDNYSNLSSKNYENYLSILYPSLYTNSPTTFSNTSNSLDVFNKLLSVNSYENSFFFYLKRIFTFTNLAAQELNSTKTLNKSSKEFLDDNISDINSVVKLMLPKSLYLTNGLLNPISSSSELTHLVKKISTYEVNKDLVILSWEWDLLLNEQLESMLNIAGTLPSSNGVFYRFSSSSNDINYLYDTTLNFSLTKNDNSTLTRFYPSQGISSKLDSSLLNDLILFSLINNR